MSRPSNRSDRNPVYRTLLKNELKNLERVLAPFPHYSVDPGKRRGVRREGTGAMTEAAILRTAPGHPNRLPDEIREGLRQFRRSSRALAALMFIPDVSAYAACFALAVAPG